MELLDLCNEHEIQVIIGVEPDKQKDISDVKRILRPPVPVRAPPRIGPNYYCPPVARIRITGSVVPDQRLAADWPSRAKWTISI